MKRILAGLFGVSLWMSLLLGVINYSALDIQFYTDRYQELDTADSIGVSQEDLLKVTHVLVDYLQGAQNDLEVEVNLNHQSVQFFNQRELDHMVDVQNLMVLSIQLQKVAMISCAILLILLLVIARKQSGKVLYQGFLEASMGLGTLFVALMLYAAVDFNAFWISFHETLFTNELWYLNPNTDNLILLVPTPFFMAMVSLIIYRILVGLGLLYSLFYGLKNQGYNSRFLKWFALGVMVVDHVGHFLFPAYLELRVLGRLAFPIFTYLFAQSYHLTRNRKQFALRVFIAAVLGQIIIYYAGATELVSIFFLFSLSILSFEAMDRKWTLALIPIALTAEFFGVDYGMYGIFVLAAFYHWASSYPKSALAYTLMTVAYGLLPFVNPELWPMIPAIIQQFFTYSWRYFIQVLSVFALIPLAFYRPEKPMAWFQPYQTLEKYFFYVFYPVHLALLALIRSGVL